MSKVTLVEQASTPSTPSAGEASLFIDQATKTLKSVDDAGSVTDYNTGGGGETNTGANVGTGTGQAEVFRDKTGSTLNFRRLIQGASVVLTQAADTVAVALGALTATLNANNQAVSNARTVSFNAEFDNGNSGGSPSIDWTQSNKHQITLTANATLAFGTAPLGPTNLMLRVLQDATGGRSVTWPGTVRWVGGTPPALGGTGANSEHLIAFYFDGTNYTGQAGLNVS